MKFCEPIVRASETNVRSLSFGHPQSDFHRSGFPPYSYVPGKFPHPLRDPQGHSFQHSPPAVVLDDPRDGRRCVAFLRGVELFNRGYYWEAHEAWEAVWIAVGRRGREADFLKGLIKLAAAGVKAREGRPEGVARHARRAAELFRSVASDSDDSPDFDDAHWGIQLHDLIRAADELARRPEVAIDESPEPVVKVLSITLSLIDS
jgi:hypothetical protein